MLTHADKLTYFVSKPHSNLASQHPRYRCWNHRHCFPSCHTPQSSPFCCCQKPQFDLILLLSLQLGNHFVDLCLHLGEDIGLCRNCQQRELWLVCLACGLLTHLRLTGAGNPTSSGSFKASAFCSPRQARSWSYWMMAFFLCNFHHINNGGPWEKTAAEHVTFDATPTHKM